MAALDFAFDLDLKRDPLRVLESTRLVLRGARHVTIDPDAVEATVERLATSGAPAADWSQQLHPPGRDAAELANLVLVVDALNFCFWNVPTSDRPRWRVTWNEQTHDGYFALALALRRAVEQGKPLYDAEYLAELTEDEVAEILAGDPGSDPIPLLHARHQHLHEVGRGLLNNWRGSFLRAIEAAHGSVARLVHEVVRTFPSFDDVAPWERHHIRFYKRAQILVADLYGAFEGQGPGRFHDLETLTAFADYKVPQVLRQHGVLRYAPELAERVRRYALVPPDSDEELEIRAATIWGVELLRQALERRGHPMRAFEIDWALWQSGQALGDDVEPYHRTLTAFY
jgi:hypothetical protein